MEEAVESVESIENKMKKTDETLDTLATQVGNIESEIFSENGQDVEVTDLLRSVSDVKSSYQNLRKEITEIQDMQRQLSSSLNVQLRMLQSKFRFLRGKIEQQQQIISSRPKSPGRPLGGK